MYRDTEGLALFVSKNNNNNLYINFMVFFLPNSFINYAKAFSMCFDMKIYLFFFNNYPICNNLIISPEDLMRPSILHF